MSEFTVCHADSGFCLAIDDERIAGGKPALMDDNVVASWVTKETYVKERTCHIVDEWASDTDVYWEDTLKMACGAEFIWAGSDYPVYCPYCGGKVVE